MQNNKSNSGAFYDRDKFNSIIEILTKLGGYKSISPDNAGCFDYIESFLNNLGFHVIVKQFVDTKNLYAEIGLKESMIDQLKVYGKSQNYSLKNNFINFCFAGHIDVVPPGPNWNDDPFTLVIKDEKVQFRGACDMKGAIGVFMQAIKDFINSNSQYFCDPKDAKMKISVLLTGDEEADATNGTQKMIEWLDNNDYKITHCILGEPTSIQNTGDNIKTGRRGSINFDIKAVGKQGHVAYPENLTNPNNFLFVALNNFRKEIQLQIIDKEISFEVTELLCENKTTNLVLDTSSAKFNTRYLGKYSSNQIISLVEKSLLKTSQNLFSYSISNIPINYTLTYKIGADSFEQNFEDEEINFLQIVSQSIEEVGLPTPSTINNGGTSDARFLHKYCKIIECGFKYETAHQKNEYISCKCIENLYNIYSAILKNFWHI